MMMRTTMLTAKKKKKKYYEDSVRIRIRQKKTTNVDVLYQMSFSFLL